MVLDSSYLVSLFISKDENHQKALLLADKHAKDDLLVPELILYETLTVINYEEGIGRAKYAYDEIMGSSRMRVIRMSDLEKYELLGEFFEQKRRFSMEDVCVIYLARKTGAAVLAFDKELLKSV